MRMMLISASLLMMQGSLAHAETCSDYPNTEGINIEIVGDGIKIISTGAAEVSVDDVAAIRDARTEATLQAKAGISKFLSEDVRSGEAVDKAVQETKSMQGQSKSALRRELVVRLTHLSSTSSALLRGVVTLGDCYTPARELRVSVGIKPETLRAAGNVSNNLADPASGASGTTAPPTQPLTNMDGFSHTDGLKKF